MSKRVRPAAARVSPATLRALGLGTSEDSTTLARLDNEIAVLDRLIAEAEEAACQRCAAARYRYRDDGATCEEHSAEQERQAWDAFAAAEVCR